MSTSTGQNGKGSKARPFSVTQKTFADRWDIIFNKKKDPVKHADNKS